MNQTKTKIMETICKLPYYNQHNLKILSHNLLRATGESLSIVISTDVALWMTDFLVI